MSNHSNKVNKNHIIPKKLDISQTVVNIPVSELKPFEAQPFKVLMDESMDELVDSVKDRGITTPIIVRPHKDGGYEIISGHRRFTAAQIAERKTVPVIIKELDDDMAIILLVDSNLQRENILPSEKAYAYKLKLEAMKRTAGRPPKENASQIATNFVKGRSDVLMAEQVGESKDQIRRYIRLTELIDPLMNLVDLKRLPINAGVELSYLGSKAQFDVLQSIEKNEIIPSIEQSAKLRNFFSEGKLNADVIDSIILEQKPQKIKITLKEDNLRKFFPSNYSQDQMEDVIFKLLKNWSRKRKEPER